MNYQPIQLKLLHMKAINFDFSTMYPTSFGSRRSAVMSNYWELKNYKKEYKDNKIMKKINKHYGIINNHKCEVINGCLEIDNKRFFMMRDELYFVMNILNKSKLKSNFLANYSEISKNENIKEVFDSLLK